MAVVVVNKKQTPGGAATATMEITSATVGDRLVVAVNQAATTSAPTGKDNISGTTGWTTRETHSVFFTGSVDSLYVMEKVAVGGETELNPTVGAGGTIQGLAYVELSGAGETLDGAIVHNDNTALGTTTTSPAMTTADAGDIILAFVGVHGGASTPTAWTGTGPMTNIGTASARCFGGSYIPGTTLSAVTFTANWTGGRTSGMVALAIKPSGGESFSGSLLGAFALTNVVKGLKVAASSLAQRIGVGGKLTGFKLASSSLTQPLGLRVILSGTPGGEAFAGQLLGFLALTGSIRGYKIASGEIREGASITPLETPFVTGEGHPPYLTLISGVSGLKSARGTLSSTVAVRGSVGGARSSSGALKVLVGFRSTVTARKSTSGSIAGSFGLRVVISQEAPPVVTVPLLFAGGGSVQAFYAGGGSAEVISAGGVSNELVYAGGGFE